ncbi:MAG TPA: hypothetical protein VLZ56_03265, partial [Mycoplana sp.]|nr:hypothetical protein [Mycoplana sp.]
HPHAQPACGPQFTSTEFCMTKSSDAPATAAAGIPAFSRLRRAPTRPLGLGGCAIDVDRVPVKSVPEIAFAQAPSSEKVLECQQA